MENQRGRYLHPGTGQDFYTSNAGLKDLKIEISKYLERKIHVEYDPDHEIMVTVGGSEGIDVALRAMLDQGDEVLIPQPSYVSYVPCTILADGNPVVIPLQQKNEFKLTAEELEAAITPKTKMLVMPFPNNPTGSIMTKEDLEPIAEVVKRHDLYVLSDEIYSELTYKTEHVSIHPSGNEGKNTGDQRILQRICHDRMETWLYLRTICDHRTDAEDPSVCNHVCADQQPVCSHRGLRHCEDEVQQMRNAYNQRRRYLVNEFAKMKLECFEPFGAFYIFPSIKEFGMTSEEFAMRFLEEEKVAVVPGSAFGESGEGFLRVSYAYSLEDLKEAIGRLSRFVERLRSQK